MTESYSILNFLASMPSGHSTVSSRGVLREIMTTTGGQLMARGHLYDIKTNHLGAGVYKIYLKLWSN